MLKVGVSQSCDTVGSAGIQSVMSDSTSNFEQYGLFLNLQSPITCTGKVTEFEYAYYKGSGNNKANFLIKLSLWRPGGDGIYTEVCQWAFHCCYILSNDHTLVIRLLIYPFVTYH